MYKHSKTKNHDFHHSPPQHVMNNSYIVSLTEDKDKKIGN